MTDDNTNRDAVDLVNREPDLTYEIDADESASEAVVRAVASLTNASILDLEPLYHAVDPDHLDGVFDEPETVSGIEGSSITFSYDGCLVTVTRDRVRVRVPDAD